MGNRVLRWDPDGRVSVFLADAEFENGHTLDHDGSIVACSHGHRRVERLGLDGTLTPIVDRYQGRRFNSPNDVVVKSDGTIWFSDPPYGITSDREGHQADSEIGDCLVFRFDPRTGELDAVTDWVDEPNGLAFSPDETVLYVSDTSAASHDDGGGNHHIAAFDVVDGRAPREPARLLHRRRIGCPTASASTSRATSGPRPTTGSTSSRRMGGASAGCRSRSGRRTAFRRPRPRSPVHHRVDVPLRDRRGHPGRGARSLAVGGASDGQAASSNSGHVTRPNARSRAPKARTASAGSRPSISASVASDTRSS